MPVLNVKNQHAPALSAHGAVNLPGVAQPPQLLPGRAQVSLIALTGPPGGGVATVSNLLTRKFGAFEMSLATEGWRLLEATKGIGPTHPDAQRLYLDLRLEKSRENWAFWVRPFHRRLLKLLAKPGHQRIVITGLVTPHEVMYARTLGAKLIHLTAPEEVRKRRIGVRYLNPPHMAADLLERFMRARPENWSLILDTDEPYGEFIHGVLAAMGPFLNLDAQSLEPPAHPRHAPAP